MRARRWALFAPRKLVSESVLFQFDCFHLETFFGFLENLFTGAREVSRKFETFFSPFYLFSLFFNFLLTFLIYFSFVTIFWHF